MDRLIIMGILNVTPDSFSDGGKYNNLDAAVMRAEEMVEEGADIIDVGGYSTRPGHSEVTEQEEIERIVPVIERLKTLDVEISVDTFRSTVAESALKAGATMINDQWRGTYDENIFSVAATYDVPVILMHNNHHAEYKDVVADVINELKKSVAVAESYGVRKENIWLDPGIGFVKTRQEELQVMERLDELTKVGYPVLLATSRKRMIKMLMDKETAASERDEATAATTIYGMEKGIKAVRVHNVGLNRKLADSYVRLKNATDG